jgi:hypothetical protein
VNQLFDRVGVSVMSKMIRIDSLHGAVTNQAVPEHYFLSLHHSHRLYAFALNFHYSTTTPTPPLASAEEYELLWLSV